MIRMRHRAPEKTGHPPPAAKGGPCLDLAPRRYGACTVSAKFLAAVSPAWSVTSALK